MALHFFLAWTKWPICILFFFSLMLPTVATNYNFTNVTLMSFQVVESN